MASKTNYEKGTKVKCKWRGDDKFHPAEIVDTRPLARLGQSASLRKLQLEYYIHYTEFDRRLDEWVTVERLGDVIVDNGAASKATGRKHRKRCGRSPPITGKHSLIVVLCFAGHTPKWEIKATTRKAAGSATGECFASTCLRIA